MPTVFIEKEGKTITVDANGSARNLVVSVGVNPETVLIVKDGVLITEEESVKDAEKIELLSVVSGG